MYLSSTSNFWRLTFKDYKQYTNLKTVILPDCKMLVGQLSEGTGYIPINVTFDKGSYTLNQAQIRGYHISRIFDTKT